MHYVVASRDKAIENENFLNRLAEALGDNMAGGSDHRPKFLPEWVLAIILNKRKTFNALANEQVSIMHVLTVSVHQHQQLWPNIYIYICLDSEMTTVKTRWPVTGIKMAGISGEPRIGCCR
jgi:hypothetical protein